MNYMTLIYDDYNVLVRIEERNRFSRAEQAGKFYTRRIGWYQVVQPKDEIEREMYYALINA